MKISNTLDFELYHRLMKDGFNISYDNLNISYKLRVIQIQSQVFKNQNNLKFLKVYVKNIIKNTTEIT